MHAVANPEADESILRLVVKESPQDALACYYLFENEESRVVAEGGGRGRAFVVSAPNPFDRERPVVIARGDPPALVVPLLREALRPGEEYVFVVTPELAEPLRGALEIRMQTTSAIYSVTRATFSPRPATGERVELEEGDVLKYCVRRGGDVLSTAGVLWASDRFAELFVFTQTEARGRGLGRAVASACTAHCLEQGITPLYIPEESDQNTIAVCRSLGYRPTGHRDYTCVGRLFTRERAN